MHRDKAVAKSVEEESALCMEKTAHLQQAKPLQMQAPTRGTWTVPRPPNRNVSYYINYYREKKES